MLSCCRRRKENQAEPDEEAPSQGASRFLFPMWVMPISTFLSMSGPPESHQELKEQGKLVEWTPGMFTIFVSHEWLGLAHADPQGAQLETLREALKRLLKEDMSVYSNLQSLFYLNKLDKISRADIKRLKDGYIWFDWCAIPQITIRSASADPQTGSDVQKAIESIPAYVEAADLFVVLCPWEEHQDTKRICNQETWGRRGWCRVELLAAALGKKQDHRLVEVRSPFSLSLMCPVGFFLALPGRGYFTVASDKLVVYGVMEKILKDHVESSWSSRNVTRARLMIALQGRFLVGLGTEEQQESLKANNPKDLETFLELFKFRSFLDVDKSGLSAVHCAAISGNTKVLSQLAQAKADLNARIKKPMPELLLQKGDTALHLAGSFNESSDSLKHLLELRADVTLQNALGHIALNSAAGAGHVECVQFLLEIGCNVNHPCNFKSLPLHSAAVNGQAGTLKVLLENTGDVNCICSLGNSSLAVAIVAGSRECVQLLLNHQADVNVRMSPRGLTPRWLFRALRATRPFLAREGPLHMLTKLEHSTPVAFASFLGHADIVGQLLQARADPVKSNGDGINAFTFETMKSPSLIRAQTLLLGAAADADSEI